jgi:TolB protein
MKRLSIALLAALAVTPWPAAQAAFPGANGRIAFEQVNTTTGAASIYTIADNGTGKRLVAGPNSESAAWSPDGRWIAYHNTAADPGGVRLFVVRWDGTHRRQVTFHPGDQGYPAWSPDGAHLVFDGQWPDGSPHGSHGGLGVVDLSTGAIRELTRRPSACDCPDSRPSWSADGTLIAFIRGVNFDKGLATLATVRPDGSGFRQLTPLTLDAGNPDWSPDSRSIVFNTNSDRFDAGQDIAVIGRQGGHVRLLTHNDPSVRVAFQPSWSPNGRSIIFTSYRLGDNHANLKIMRADGIGRRAVHTGAQISIRADWGVRPIG